jgi:hypothetical protein
MAKRKQADTEMTDKELARRLFPRSVRKQLKTALSALDREKQKRTSAKKR